MNLTPLLKNLSQFEYDLINSLLQVKIIKKRDLKKDFSFSLSLDDLRDDYKLGSYSENPLDYANTLRNLGKSENDIKHLLCISSSLYEALKHVSPTVDKSRREKLILRKIEDNLDNAKWWVL